MEFSQDTKRQVGFFREKFMKLGYGEGHYLLACHAAFPIAITPDLLYQLWANFKNYEAYLTEPSPRSIDMIAVSDLLMSNLVQPTGNDFFEMGQEVRGYLLQQLVEDLRFGERRLVSLAKFLYQYTDATNWDSDIKNAQHWAALSTLDPEKAVGQIMEAFDGHIRNKNESEILRFRELFEAYNYQDERFTEVLEFSKGIKAEIFGYDVGVVERQFNKAKVLAIDKNIQPDDRRLEIPLWETLEAKVKIFTSAKEQESWQEALSRIATAKEQQATKLNLSNLGLKEIPAAAFELVNLEELDLYNNRLTKFPKEISQLKSLRKLLVSKNPIRTLPSALFSTLRYLEVLKIDDAKIKALPQSLFKARYLSNFSAENNQIEFLSPAITEMKNLRLLDLRGNPVLNVPERYLKATSSKIKGYFEGVSRFEKDIPVMLVLLFGESENMGIQKEKDIIIARFQKKLEEGQIHLEILYQPTTVELFLTIKHFENNLTIVHIAAFNGEKGFYLKNEKEERVLVEFNTFVQFFESLPITAKLFVFNSSDSYVFGEGKLKLKAEAIIGYHGYIPDSEAINFTDYLYKNLLDKKRLGVAFTETLSKISEREILNEYIERHAKLSSEQLNSNLWQLHPPKITDLSPIQRQLKEHIAQYEINRFFREWSKHFPEEYKKETVAVLKKQHRAYANRQQANDVLDQNTFSKIASGFLRLVDEAKIENTRAATIRNWRLFEGVDFSKLLDTPLLPLPIELVGDAKLKARFNRYYQKNPSKFLDIQERITANYELRLEKNTIAIWTKDVRPKLIHGVKGFADEDIEYIVDVVEQIEKWERISNLDNEQTELEEEKIEVRLLKNGNKEMEGTKNQPLVSLQGEPLANLEGKSLIGLEKESFVRLEYKNSMEFEIQVRNLSNTKLYFAIIHFNENFGISDLEVSNVSIDKNSEWTTPFRDTFYLEFEAISTKYTFKAIFSTSPIETNIFRESDIIPAIVIRGQEGKEIGKRAISFEIKKNVTEDWCAKKLTVEIVRQEYELWQRIRNSDIEIDYLEYISYFSNGKYTEIAKKKVQEIHNKRRKAAVKKSNKSKQKRTEKGISNILYGGKMETVSSKEVEFNKAPLEDGLEEEIIDFDKWKEKVRNLIAHNQIEEVFDFLHNTINAKSYAYNNTINLTSRYNQNKKREMQNMVTPESTNITMNQILIALLNLIDEMKPQDLKNNSKT